MSILFLKALILAITLRPIPILACPIQPFSEALLMV
jgi:hypothetical protein